MAPYPTGVPKEESREKYEKRIPGPDHLERDRKRLQNQSPEMNCDALNTERTRLLAERADLKSPLLSSNTDAEREAELTQLNGKLYTIAKAQSDKSCPLIANAPPSPPSTVVQ